MHYFVVAVAVKIVVSAGAVATRDVAVVASMFFQDGCVAWLFGHPAHIGIGEYNFLKEN